LVSKDKKKPSDAPIAFAEPKKNKDKIVVIGGGPAGSFFAIFLLREARRLNRELDVVIVEKKAVSMSEGGYWWSKGCNFDAGGVSPTLSAMMEEAGIHVPPETIRGEINRIWIHGMWKNIPLKVPNQMRMFSVFRGSLPSESKLKQRGLDAFLLEKAIKEGARILRGDVLEVAYGGHNIPVLKIRMASGDEVFLPASFVAVATGVNARTGKDYGTDPLIRSIQRINPDFAPAKLRRALVFELKVSPEVLEKNLKNEVYFIEYGSKELPLEHIALIPKGDYLTVTVIGKYIDRAALPKDTREIIKRILKLPHLNRILPDIAAYPVACSCSPNMTVSVARNPAADNLAVIGDAVGSRLYKDGLYSAYLSASQLAQIVMNNGSDKDTLIKEYGKTVRWLSRDNRYGNIVFRLIRITFSNPFLSRILYQTFATELKIRDKNKRPLGQVLWKVASGYANYREILADMFSLPALQSVLIGGLFMTMRNIFTEFVFGLKWRDYGRYPTVVLKEKRDYFKSSLSRALGMEMDGNPDFERMYAIKVKAAKKEIFGELGKFGSHRSNFMRLRFVEIMQKAGLSNQMGSIIRYKIRYLPVWMDMKLTHVIPDEVLYYEVSERYADRGKLIFEIKSTEDGNNRLVIYTSFDYKKGKRAFAKMLWWFVRMLFPVFVHDVVWNHALCSIKQDAELAEQRIS
jgi:flavin-dependent dehydrogenase